MYLEIVPYYIIEDRADTVFWAILVVISGGNLPSFLGGGLREATEGAGIADRNYQPTAREATLPDPVGGRGSADHCGKPQGLRTCNRGDFCRRAPQHVPVVF